MIATDGSSRLSWIQEHSVSMSIEINEHKAVYMTVAQFLDDDAEKMDRFGDLGQDVRAQCIAKNQLVVLQVYPDSPVGFLLFVHHDVELAIADAYFEISEEPRT